MKAMLHRLFLAGCIAAIAAIAGSAAHAQTWPAKPLKLVVPYAAGGATDQLARAVADPLGRALGQAVVVDESGEDCRYPAASFSILSEADSKLLERSLARMAA